MDTRDSDSISHTPTPQKKFIAKGIIFLLNKVVVLGDVNVGKSNIIRRILGEDFQELEATIGVEFGYYNVPDIDADDPSVNLNLQIWDTSGSERYRAITTRNADGAILVYDITSEASFTALDFWYDVIKKATKDNIVIYLLGNKSDIVKFNPSNRKIEREKALEFIMRYNIFFWSECSAKDNSNIQETFKSFYKSVFAVQKDKLEEKTKDLKKIFESKRQDPKMKCCA